MIKKIGVLKVKYLPKELEPGILYFSKKYGVAGHLCPCGCGNKIITPLDSTEWHLSIKRGNPTLYPSIGNWQLPCKSHYWIINGRIEWSNNWSEEQIIAGNLNEENRRRLYYERPDSKRIKWSLLCKIRKYFQNWK